MKGGNADDQTNTPAECEANIMTQEAYNTELNKERQKELDKHMTQINLALKNKIWRPDDLCLYYNRYQKLPLTTLNNKILRVSWPRRTEFATKSRMEMKL